MKDRSDWARTARGMMAAVGFWLLLSPVAHALALVVPDDPGRDPLELESQVMAVRIDNQAAQTRITQVFYNRYNQRIEATYLLPIPKGAHVTDFAMEMNGKKVHGEVLEKEKARQIYTDIVRRVRDPGLLEYVDQEIFRARIFPIPPNGRQQVDITVTHLLPMDNGVVEYQWPFEAPRSVQQRGRPTAPGEFDVKLEVRSKVPLKSIYSPTHKIEVKREGEREAVVRLADKPDRDQPIFRCYYTLSDKAVGLHALTARDEDKDGTFLLLISPGELWEGKKLPPVDFTFVLDVSGSMAEDKKIDAAKKALNHCLAALRAEDAFTIIRFSTEVETFAEEFLAANEENLKRARQFVEDLRARGGTNIDGALEQALKRKARQGRLHTLLFITDGKPTVGITDVDQILRNVEKKNEAHLRVFVCGVGYDVNTRLLDRLAEQTRSIVQYIRPNEDLEVAVSGLFDKISKPVLTGLRIEWGDLKVNHVYPKELPDLFAGTQLTVFGRYGNGGDRAITLYGKVGDEEKKFVYEATFPEKPHDEHAFIETLWATRRVGYLLDQIRQHGESKELREEVIDLAKEHGIVTPYTSYLVQEDERRDVAMATRPETVVLGGVRATPGPPAPGDVYRYHVPLAEGAETRDGERAARGASPGAYFYGLGGAGGRAISADGLSAGWPAAESSGLAVSAPGESGEKAVEYSRRLGDLKVAERVAGVAGPAGANYKAVSGKTFQQVGDAWVELREKAQKVDESKKPKILKIKYLSDGYFDLVRLRPDLKKVFVLGEKVELEINDYRVVIGPEGEEKLSKDQLEALAAKK